MAVPKRRVSKARKLKRRAHHHLKKPSLSTCPQCHAPTMPHRVCNECGSYGGRRIVSTTTD
jgi:large subunit ribosomal protein L32